MTIHKPSWFSDEHVLISTAPTCGLTKGGRLLMKVDPSTATRVRELDPETGELVDVVNDQLLADMEALSVLKSGGETQTDLPATLRFVPTSDVSLRCAVPGYYDHRYTEAYERALATDPIFKGYSSATLGDLVERQMVYIRGGHGSPSQEQRIGEVPYIKVSDLRAGLVNINPTNRVPRAVAESYWRGPQSGLEAFDLLCPERTSKNIGDFCVLMPGQEQVLTTKEVIVLRAGPNARFGQFYLLWAMTLKIVRDQWKRIIFMQTNREDVGDRFLEVAIPIAPSREEADRVSAPFERYFQSIANARTGLHDYLSRDSRHHFFVSGAATEDEPTDDSGLVESLPEGQ